MWDCDGLQPSQNKGKTAVIFRRRITGEQKSTPKTAFVCLVCYNLRMTFLVAAAGHHRLCGSEAAAGQDKLWVCTDVVVLAQIPPLLLPPSCLFPGCPRKGKHSGGHCKKNKEITAQCGYIQPSGHKQTALVYSGDICIKCSSMHRVVRYRQGVLPPLTAESPFWSSSNL